MKIKRIPEKDSEVNQIDDFELDDLVLEELKTSECLKFLSFLTSSKPSVFCVEYLFYTKYG